MSRSSRLPKYRRHSSGQARVTINGKDHLLGPYGSPASRQAYERTIAEWLSCRSRANHDAADAKGLMVNELILSYWTSFNQHDDSNSRRGDYYCLRDALKVVRSLYGDIPALTFGPRALKACRQKMIDKDWSRNYINAQVNRIRRMFRWAASEEMLPGDIYQNLRAVANLRAGATLARETPKVRPVPQEHVDAALPFMPLHVRAMVRLQCLLGCRPDEICRLRPIDLDRSNPECWIYRPGSDQGKFGAHKTAHHDIDRIILLGPRAQEILRPYLEIEQTAFCFNPRKFEHLRNAQRRANRASPMTPNQAQRPAARRLRAPSDQYDTASYRRAIARACKKANRAARKQAEQDDPATPPDKIFVQTWCPNRLRHNRATELRPYGLDLTKTILGHQRVETTQIYAEKDLRGAMELVSKIG